MKAGATSRILGVAFFILWSGLSSGFGAELWQGCVAGSIAGIFGVLLGIE